MIPLIPSLLGADPLKIYQEIEKIIDFGINRIHLDIMDGHFVPNLSFGPHHLRAIKVAFPALSVDVHLMVDSPGLFIPMFADHKVDCLTIHPESTPHILQDLAMIRDRHQVKAGIAINPQTDPSVLNGIGNSIDHVLIMGVNPGFGGQEFILQTLDKIHQVRKWIIATGRPITLTVDGGVNLSNGQTILDAGADALVVGTSFFHDMVGWGEWLKIDQ